MFFHFACLKRHHLCHIFSPKSPAVTFHRGCKFNLGISELFVLLTLTNFNLIWIRVCAWLNWKVIINNISHSELIVNRMQVFSFSSLIHIGIWSQQHNHCVCHVVSAVCNLKNVLLTSLSKIMVSNTFMLCFSPDNKRVYNLIICMTSRLEDSCHTDHMEWRE